MPLEIFGAKVTKVDWRGVAIYRFRDSAHEAHFAPRGLGALPVAEVEYPSHDLSVLCPIHVYPLEQDARYRVRDIDGLAQTLLVGRILDGEHALE